jgi:hypothetical protein
MKTCDPIAIHNEVIRVAGHVISPILPQRIRALDQNGWKSLATQIQHSRNGVAVFLNTFQSRLNPDQITILLDLEDSLSQSLTFYTIFPDIAGVPIDQLPDTRTPPEQLQRDFCELTATDLRKVLALAKELSETIAK